MTSNFTTPSEENDESPSQAELNTFDESSTQDNSTDESAENEHTAEPAYSEPIAVTSNKVLFLASASSRRHEILNQLMVEHTVLEVPVFNTSVLDDEPQLPNEIPLSYVQRTAREKLDRAIEYIQDQIAGGNPEFVDKDIYILTADTVVTCKNDILGKPISAEHAAIQLERLADNEHTVYTAVNLWHDDTFYKDISSTQVQFGPLTEEQISAYCQTEEPYGKAGAYAIQGMAASFVKHLRGSYTGVVGLPAFETMRLLQRSGFVD